jgi:tRNA pseudouridine-54 N-methylase
MEVMDGRCTKEDCFLIQYIVITRKGLDTSAFPLNDLSVGRMDLKARAICSSLYISNGIR